MVMILWHSYKCVSNEMLCFSCQMSNVYVSYNYYQKLCGGTSLALLDLALGGRFLGRLRFLDRQLFTKWISVYRERVPLRDIQI